jgi:hypothetical protein
MFEAEWVLRQLFKVFNLLKADKNDYLERPRSKGHAQLGIK